MHYERRKFPEQNFDDDNKNHYHRHWDQQQRTNNFFERRRTYQSDYHRDDDEEKEPEWMKGLKENDENIFFISFITHTFKPNFMQFWIFVEGPDSKHDFIELRGFDDNVLKSFKRNGSKL